MISAISHLQPCPGYGSFGYFLSPISAQKVPQWPLVVAKIQHTDFALAL